MYHAGVLSCRLGRGSCSDVANFTAVAYRSCLHTGLYKPHNARTLNPKYVVFLVTLFQPNVSKSMEIDILKTGYDTGEILQTGYDMSFYSLRPIPSPLRASELLPQTLAATAREAGGRLSVNKGLGSYLVHVAHVKDRLGSPVLGCRASGSRAAGLSLALLWQTVASGARV